MSKENKSSAKSMASHGPGGFVLFVTYIGAAVYFVQQSAGFWGFVLALLKAIVWPAYVINHVLQALRV